MSQGQRPLTPSRGCTETVEQWLSLVHWVIRRRLPLHVRQRIEYDDAFQAGVIGLMHAIRLFDDGRGVKFGTYAIHKIRWNILIEAGLTRQGWAPLPSRLPDLSRWEAA